MWNYVRMGNFLDIMIPAYGESPYLQETIDSIIDSGLPDDCKIYVVDDASPTDHIARISTLYAKHVTYLKNQTNLGVGGNFKYCQEHSDADLTMIIGSDDRLLPGAIDALRDAYKSDPDAVLYQLQVRTIDKEGNLSNSLADKVKRIISPNTRHQKSISGTNLITRLFLGDWMYFPAIAWNSRHFQKFDWSTGFQTAVDLDLLFDLALKGLRFNFVDFIGFEYRRHGESVSTKLIVQGKRIDEELQVQATAFKRLDFFQKITMGLVAVLAPTIRLHGIKAALEIFPKNPKLGIKLLQKSLKVSWFVTRQNFN